MFDWRQWRREAIGGALSATGEAHRQGEDLGPCWVPCCAWPCWLCLSWLRNPSS
jgi:hypothetical protein